MPMSTKRANFYKEVYFPSVYYGELFKVTLEEAKDKEKAQAELLKMLIDADANLSRLSATYRVREPGLASQFQAREDRKTLDVDEQRRINAAKFADAMKDNPVSATGLTEKIKGAKIGEGGLTPTEADIAKRALTEIYREASKYEASNPAMARRIMADGLRTAEKQGIKFGAVATDVNQRVQDIAGQGIDRKALEAQVASTGDKKQVSSFTAGAGAPPSPETEEAEARLNAMASPFANASTEQTNHVAAGITDEQDELLRLYLTRLQDKDSPGEVTPDEIAASPELAAAEEVYNSVVARNSYLKTGAEWFSAEYLTALKTKAMLEKKAEKDPFEGLDPYRWAQKQAFERGGYTKESVLYLRMLSERPDLAPYVTPAFTRLRDDKGMEPKDAAEAVVRAAFEQNPKLTVAELDAELAKKRAELAKTGRQVAREAGVLTKEGMKERRAAREVGAELYGSPEAAEAAKAYLLALRLNRAGTKATPTTGTEIVGAAPLTPPVSPQVGAGATVNRAAAKAKDDAQKAAEAAQAAQDAEGGPTPTPTPTTPKAPPKPPPAPAPEAEVERTLQERVRTLPPAQQAFLATLPGKELPGGQQATPSRGFTTDPTNPDYKYMRTPTGDYAVLYKGLPVDPAKKGTRAAQSIERVLAGQPPLPLTPPATPPPAPPAPMSRITLPPTDIRAPAAPPAPAPAPVSEAAQLRALLKSKTITPGTPQYDAALDRLIELGD